MADVFKVDALDLVDRAAARMGVTASVAGEQFRSAKLCWMVTINQGLVVACWQLAHDGMG